MSRRRSYNMGRAMREELLSKTWPDDTFRDRLEKNHNFNYTDFTDMCIQHPDTFIKHLKVAKNGMIPFMIRREEIPASFLIHVYENYVGSWSEDAKGVRNACLNHPKCPDEIKFLHRLTQ